jgi:hypothetical protein
MHRIVASSFAVLVAGCAVPEVPTSIERETTTREGDEFPAPVTLAEFDGKWFTGKRSVTFVERAEEGEGYRALGIDVDTGQITYQIVGPREEVRDVMNLSTIAGLELEGCGISQGVFTPPPVPPPSCGGRRCQPIDYVSKAQALVELSCR